MRTNDNIIESYLEWYYPKIKDEKYNPKTFFKGDEIDVKVRKAYVWKKILDMCYYEKDGAYWFFKFILKDLIYAGYPEPIRFNKLLWEWTKLSKTGDHIVILCPRQHGKSTFWSVLTTIYRATIFKNYNVLIESSAEEQAIIFMDFISKIIKNNEFLMSRVSLKGRWSSSEISYNGGKIVGKGLGSEVRGGTYDLIIVDDVLRSDNKFSDEDVESFIDEELEPMLLVRGGQIIVVGTKKSSTDIFETLQERAERDGAWKFIKYQAIIDWEKHIVLCPDRFTWEQLMQKRKTMGFTKFDKEFQCESVSRGSRVFSDDVLTTAKKLGIGHEIQERANKGTSDPWSYYMGIDTARAGTASADYTVAFILGYNSKTHKKRLCWVWRKKGMKIINQVKEIGETALKYNYPVVLVEKNNLGQDFIDELVARYNLTIESFTTTPKSKEDLIRFLVSEFENERILLPGVDKKSRDMTKMVVGELSKFIVEITRAGNEIMKGSGRSKDDIVIALALANKATQAFSNIPFMQAIPADKGKTELELYAETNDMANVIKSGF